MRHSIVFVAGLVCLSALGESAFSSEPSKTQTQVAQPALRPDADFGNIPLYFIPNRGQADSRALFSARAEGFTLWATRNGLLFDQRSHSVTPGVTGPAQRSNEGAVLAGGPPSRDQRSMEGPAHRRLQVPRRASIKGP